MDSVVILVHTLSVVQEVLAVRIVHLAAQEVLVVHTVQDFSVAHAHHQVLAVLQVHIVLHQEQVLQVGHHLFSHLEALSQSQLIQLELLILQQELIVLRPHITVLQQLELQFIQQALHIVQLALTELLLEIQLIHQDQE